MRTKTTKRTAQKKTLHPGKISHVIHNFPLFSFPLLSFCSFLAFLVDLIFVFPLRVGYGLAQRFERFLFPFLAFHFSITEDIFLEVSIYILLRKMSLFIYRYINSRKTRFSEHDSILQQLRQLYAKSHAFVLIACIKLGFTSALRRLASVMKQKQKKTFWKWFVEPSGLVYVSEVVDCSWKHC